MIRSRALNGRGVLAGHLVRVEIHRNADLAVAQSKLDDLRSNPGVGVNLGLGMTQVVEPDAGDASFLSDAIEFLLDVHRVERFPALGPKQ